VARVSLGLGTEGGLRTLRLRRRRRGVCWVLSMLVALVRLRDVTRLRPSFRRVGDSSPSLSSSSSSPSCCSSSSSSSRNNVTRRDRFGGGASSEPRRVGDGSAVVRWLALGLCGGGGPRARPRARPVAVVRSLLRRASPASWSGRWRSRWWYWQLVAVGINLRRNV
jgi:hypothetical protein